MNDSAARRRAHWSLSVAAALAALLVASACYHAVRDLVFSRSTVTNSRRSDDLGAMLPKGFIQQSPSAPGLQRFRRQIPDEMLGSKPEIERIVAIRRWVRDQQPDGRGVWEGAGETVATDPEVLLRGQRSGLPGACRRFSYVLIGALLSAGFQARFVSMTDSFHETPNQHAMAEVWVASLNKWVLVDATLDTMFLVDDHYASLVELRSALMRREFARIRFARHGSTRLPAPRLDVYAAIARHVWFSNTNAVFDGYRVSLFRSRRMTFVHLVDGAAGPYPEAGKNALLAVMAVCLVIGVTALRRFATSVAIDTVASKAWSTTPIRARRPQLVAASDQVRDDAA